MPYTNPLRVPPSRPHPQAPIANPDGTPAKPYVDYFVALDAWIERVRQALDELEP